MSADEVTDIRIAHQRVLIEIRVDGVGRARNKCQTSGEVIVGRECPAAITDELEPRLTRDDIPPHEQRHPVYVIPGTDQVAHDGVVLQISGRGPQIAPAAYRITHYRAVAHVEHSVRGSAGEGLLHPQVTVHSTVSQDCLR